MIQDGYRKPTPYFLPLPSILSFSSAFDAHSDWADPVAVADQSLRPDEKNVGLELLAVANTESRARPVNKIS